MDKTPLSEKKVGFFFALVILNNSMTKRRQERQERVNVNKLEQQKPHKFHLNFLNGEQQLAWAAYQQHAITFLIGPAGTGKAQPLDAIVFTPDGPKKMGDIKIGDVVSTPDGGTASVSGVFPQGERDIYRIVFRNGDSVEACGEHLWKIDSKSSRGWRCSKIVDTDYIRSNCKTPKGRRNFDIKCSNAVYFNEKPVPIDSYLLGLLIGDGGLTGGSVVLTTADEFIINEVKNILSDGYYIKNHSGDYGYIITTDSNELNKYKLALKDLGLWGCRSWEKTIPDIYLYNSNKVRISMVQGLLDTDGTVDKRGRVSLCTTSHILAEQFKTLIQSLGGDCMIKEVIKKFRYRGKIKEGRVAYNCCVLNDNCLSFFRLPRKKCRVKSRTKYFVKRIIDRVEYVAKKECRCILIDHPDHLYITNHFVPTHNTHLAMAFAIYDILQRNKKRIILTRPIVEAGESLGYLPGEFEEKVSPYMMPLYDAMEKLVGGDERQKEIIGTSVEIAPLAYLRGRNFTDAVCIFDEAQNATVMQLKLYLTRLGDNSKIIVTGDPQQSDLKDSGLLDVVRRVESVAGVSTIRFKKESIVRNPIVASILERFDE